MRIRTIKPEFWSHPVLGRMSDEARLAAIGLLNLADDEGYFHADPALVRSALWTFDEDSSRARRALEQLSNIGWISIAQHPTHGPIGLVVNFSKHQRVDRPSPSKIKQYHDSTNIRRDIADHSCLEQGTGNREQGTGKSVGAPPGVPELGHEPPATPSPPTTTPQGTRLPKDWLLPKSWGEWALQERSDWKADDVRRVAEMFRDHWVANANRREGKKADWEATWHNWVRKEGPLRGQAPPGQNRQQALEESNRAVARRWKPPELRQGDAD